MPVVDAGLPLAPHPFHSFHEGALVVHFQVFGVQPDLHLLSDEPGGHGVGPSGCLDGAPLAHPRPVVDVLRHRGWGQGTQMWALFLQLPLLRFISWVRAEVLSERITLGTPPSSHRAFWSPCFRARKVSPATTSA